LDSPEGQVLFTYHKAKPTPGEGNYGDGIIKYFDSPYGRISSTICFDMDFPSLISQVNKMNIDITVRHDQHKQDFDDYIKVKLEHLSERFPYLQSVHVILEEEKKHFKNSDYYAGRTTVRNCRWT